MSSKPAEYWRRNKSWQKWLGQEGKVVGATYIKVAAKSFSEQAPYSFAVVDLGKKKKEFMGCGHEKLTVGDTVKIVLRRVVSDNRQKIVDYRLKAKKI